MRVFFVWLWLTGLVCAQEHIRLAFTGDVDPSLLTRAYNRAEMAYRVGECDAVIGNLECVLTNAVSAFTSKYLLKAPPETGVWLRKAGFTVMNLANDHSLDYQGGGLRDTLAALKSAGIQWCGAGLDLRSAGAPVIVLVGPMRVAVIGYSEIAPPGSQEAAEGPGIAWLGAPPDRAPVLASIRQARAARADLVVVCLHWGKAGSARVEPYQRTFARALIDGGADCVIGHHPHVLRAIERYRGRTIAYSLGNYVFKGTKETCLLKIDFQQSAQGKWLQQAHPEYPDVDGGIPHRPMIRE